MPRSFTRGVGYAHNYQGGGSRGYGSATSRASQQELKELGVTALALTPFGYLSGPEATEIQMMDRRPGAENDTRIRQEVMWAREAGMSVLLKPHLWVQGGVYRGEIDPGTPARWLGWWESYRGFVLHYAALAQSLEVSMLCIGVELDQTTTRFAAEWRALVHAVREVFSGELVYAANWDTVKRVPFWRELDAIGVQFYPPLKGDRRARTAALSTHLRRLSALGSRTGRPVLLTEVGYRSGPGALAVPHRWPNSARDRRDDAAQAEGYRLLFRQLRDHPRITGAYIWKWYTDPERHEEGEVGFSPRGKPAAAVLRGAFMLPR